MAADASPALRLISHHATSSPSPPPQAGAGATREQTTESSSATSTTGHAESAGTAKESGMGQPTQGGKKNKESRSRADEGTRGEGEPRRGEGGAAAVPSLAHTEGEDGGVAAAAEGCGGLEVEVEQSPASMAQKAGEERRVCTAA